MAAVLLVTASVSCPHGARAMITPSNQRVRIGGVAAALVNDTTTVAGCPFQAGQKPQPCVKVVWSAPATRVKVAGQPVLIESSSGLCQSAEQIPQGSPVVTPAAPRVTAS